MKPLLVVTLLTSILRPGHALDSNGTNSSLDITERNAPHDFTDSSGLIPKGHFSFWVHSGKVEFYSDKDSAWYAWGLTVKPCEFEDVHPFHTGGWKNITAEESHLAEMPSVLWIHPGNQCGGAHTRGQQLDNFWVWYKPATNTPGANFINVIKDPRCQEMPYQNPSPTEWPQILCYRCVLPLGEKKKDPKPVPVVGVPQKSKKKKPLGDVQGQHRGNAHA